MDVTAFSIDSYTASSYYTDLMEKLILKSNKTCLSKVWYATEPLAVLVLEAKQKIKYNTPEAYVYKCPACNGFHISSGKR